MTTRTYQLWKDVAVALMPLRDRITADPEVNMTLKKVTEHIRFHRQAQRYVENKSRINVVRDAIKRDAKKIAAKMRERLFITVLVGKTVSGKKDKKDITLIVGHMWLHRVMPIYKDGFTHKNLFLLKAEEYRVPQKKTRLWECVAFDFLTGGKRRIYLSKSELGDPKYTIADTATAAIKAAFAHNQAAITKRLSGEEHAEDH